MKNIHVLPTDKPSRLVKNNLGIVVNEDYTQSILDLIQAIFVNIYITSDEEIKEGDWIFSTKTNNLFKADSIEYLKNHNMIEDFNKSFYINSKYAKKIILTTNQLLDDVQAIDDEFLEWFVKNPSCEEVKVEITEISCIIPNFGDVDKYRIAIPKEEQKQHLIDIMKADEELGLYEEQKQETTLEEAAENYVNNFEYGIAHPRRVCKNAFINGAKSDAAKAYWYNIFKQNL